MADINLNFGSDDLKKIEQFMKNIQKAAKNIASDVKKTGRALGPDLKKAKELATATKKLVSEKKKLTAIEREEIRQLKRLETLQAKNALATSKTAKEIIKQERALRDVNRQLRTGSKNTASWGKALGSFQFKFNALGNIAANVTSQISRQFTRAMRSSIKVIVDFEQAMADVKAITGSTGKEFDKLRDSAKQLAGITKFTASEVAALQKQYAKLGFSTQEILNAQAATLDLAAATGEDLARSAEIAGATLRGFRLRASESKRVVDVMARSFTSSALDLDRFAESMKFVAPIAAQANVSIEETTALLATMADAGIHGSRAGTALRVIFSQLSGEGENLADQLKILSKEGLTLAGAEDEVGRRAQTALLVLLDQIEQLPKLTKAFQDAGGAAQEMADIQLNTIAGQAAIVKSAWQGMVLEISESETDFREIKGTLNFVTDFLNAIANMSKTGLRFGDQFFIERSARQITAEILEDYRFTMSDLKTGFKGLGGIFAELGGDLWEQLFPKATGDNVVSDLENIDELVKKLGETFTEGDQEGWDLFGINHWLEEFNEKRKPEIQQMFDDLRKLNSDYLEGTLDDVTVVEDKKLEIFQAGLAAAGDLVNTFSDLFASAKEKELSAVGQNAEERERIEIEYAKKEQRLAIASAAINSAEAITQIWSKWAANPIVAGILTAISLGTTATQIAIIKNQKFAEGGWIGGESHSRGGTQIEAEKGEFVIRKRSASKYSDLIEAINQDDQMRIMNAMGRDKKIMINGGNNPDIRRMRELMEKQPAYGEDNDYYYKDVGNTIIKTRKN